MQDLIRDSFEYLKGIDTLEASGLIFGLLSVYFLIKENIWTWPSGITYILISFVIFWQQQLYGDFLLHVFFLILNIYGWYHWLYGSKENTKVPITRLNFKENVVYGLISLLGVGLFGYFLSNIHLVFTNLTPASVPYWDAATTSLSVTAMWLTARKRIENWHYWFIVDVLAAAIYFYKGIYFYSLLYFIYIALAIAGYLQWKKIMTQQT
ncbi:MAG TPA: nicotinamide riboside transporter PnuC [Fulvivirga sp.]|nr:nicotinamide riboside transporter PnuC [Fulvivirga sp.]